MGDIIFFRLINNKPPVGAIQVTHGKGIWLADRVFDTTITLSSSPELDRDRYRMIEAAILRGDSSVTLDDGRTVQWRIISPWNTPEEGEPELTW